jgi:hypothetical protein
MRMTLPFALALAAPLALAACGDPVDPDKLEEVAAEPTTPPILEEDPAAPEELGETAELEADENVPSLAEVQLALAQCNYPEDVIDATCTTSEDAEQFTCRYQLEGDLPETDREFTMAADGTSYSLVEVPEDCPIQ